MSKQITDIQDEITKATAERLLKNYGLSVKGMADYLGIQSRSLRETWRHGGLNRKQTLMLIGYIFKHSEHCSLHQFSDDAVIKARLQQLQNSVDDES